jgi:nucleotide-binding universal stress UspA family protein
VHDIVVHSLDFRHWQAGVRYAAQLAAWVRGSLTGLYVAAPPGPVAGPRGLIEEATAYAQDELNQAMLAGRRFVEWANQQGVSESRWQVAVGSAADALVLAAHWNDLVVLQGHAPSASSAEHALCEVLLSGAACLVVPPDSMMPGRVTHALVASNDTLASNRAMHDALPLLQAAESVTLLLAHADQPSGRASRDVPAQLRARGVPVTDVETLAATDEGIGENLLALAADRRADLLVLGASGNRRPGGCCFGATTGTVLSRSAVPVFLRY